MVMVLGILGLLVVVVGGGWVFPGVNTLPRWRGVESLTSKWKLLVKLPKLLIWFFTCVSAALIWIGPWLAIPYVDLKLKFGQQPWTVKLGVVIFAAGLFFGLFALAFGKKSLKRVASGERGGETASSGEATAGDIVVREKNGTTSRTKLVSKPAERGMLRTWGSLCPGVIVPPSKYFSLSFLWDVIIFNIARRNTDIDEFGNVTTKDGADAKVKGSISWAPDYDPTQGGGELLQYNEVGGQDYVIDIIMDRMQEYVMAAASIFPLLVFQHVYGIIALMIGIRLCEEPPSIRFVRNDNVEPFSEALLAQAIEEALQAAQGNQTVNGPIVPYFPKAGLRDSEGMGVRYYGVSIYGITPDDPELKQAFQQPEIAKHESAAARTRAGVAKEHLAALKEEDVTPDIASMQAHLLAGVQEPGRVSISEVFAPDLQGLEASVAFLLQRLLHGGQSFPPPSSGGGSGSGGGPRGSPGGGGSGSQSGAPARPGRTADQIRQDRANAKARKQT